MLLITHCHKLSLTFSRKITAKVLTKSRIEKEKENEKEREIERDRKLFYFTNFCVTPVVLCRVIMTMKNLSGLYLLHEHHSTFLTSKEMFLLERSSARRTIKSF